MFTLLGSLFQQRLLAEAGTLVLKSRVAQGERDYPQID
jgi:hypothetical protein